jgi:hypothetical protein
MQKTTVDWSPFLDRKSTVVDPPVVGKSGGTVSSSSLSVSCDTNVVMIKLDVVQEGIERGRETSQGWRPGSFWLIT